MGKQATMANPPCLLFSLSLSLAVLIQLPGITGCAATAGAGLTLADYTAK